MYPDSPSSCRHTRVFAPSATSHICHQTLRSPRFNAQGSSLCQRDGVNTAFTPIMSRVPGILDPGPCGDRSFLFCKCKLEKRPPSFSQLLSRMVECIDRMVECLDRMVRK